MSDQNDSRRADHDSGLSSDRVADHAPDEPQATLGRARAEERCVASARDAAEAPHRQPVDVLAGVHGAVRLLRSLDEGGGELLVDQAHGLVEHLVRIAARSRGVRKAARKRNQPNRRVA